MYSRRLFLLLLIVFLGEVSRCYADVSGNALRTGCCVECTNLEDRETDDTAYFNFNKFMFPDDSLERIVCSAPVCGQNISLSALGELAIAEEERRDSFPYLLQIFELEEPDHSKLGCHLHSLQDSTVSYYKKLLDVVLHRNEPSWLACLNMHLAAFCFKVKRYADAEKHIDIALHYVYMHRDIRMIMMAWQLRAVIKARVGKWEESLRSVKSAWQIAGSQYGNDEWQLHCIPGFLYYYLEKGESDSVDHYLKVGNQLLAVLSEKSDMVTTDGFILARALVSYERAHYEEALKDMLGSGLLRRRTEKSQLYKMIADSYHHIGQDEKAYVYMDSAYQYTDLQAKKEVTLQMAKFNVKYVMQQQNLRIAGLQQEILQKRVNLFEISILLLCILIAVFILVWRQINKQKKARRRIRQLKQEKELEATRCYIDGLEEECRYFAKELHDGIANDLLALQMKAELEGNKEWASAVGRLLCNVRAISHELMPPEFEYLNLDQILASYVKRLAESTSVEIVYEGLSVERDEAYPIPQRVAYELYRVTQEVLMNILKYAEATQVVVSMSLEPDGSYCLRITDDGEKLPDVNSMRESGIGFRTVAHRVRAIQASMETRYEKKNSEFKLIFNLKNIA